MSNQVLHLTGIIKRGEGSEIYLGRIKEITGIISQGATVQEAYDNLVKTTRAMLEYRRPQALALLAEQNRAPELTKTNARLDFNLELA